MTVISNDFETCGGGSCSARSVFYTVDDATYASAIALLEGIAFQGCETVAHAGFGRGMMTEALLGCVPQGKVVVIDDAEDITGATHARLRRCGGIDNSHGQYGWSVLRGHARCDFVYANRNVTRSLEDLAAYASYATWLRPDGTLALQFLDTMSTRSPLHTAVDRVRRRKPFCRYLTDCAENYPLNNEQYARTLMSELSLDVTGCQRRRWRLLPATLRDVKGWLCAAPLSPYLCRIPNQGLIDSFTNEVLEELGERLASVLRMPTDIICILAHRRSSLQ